MKHIASRFNVGGVLTLLILLSACSEQAPANIEQPVEAASPAPNVVERIVRVTLSEGTNLALTVDPVSGDRVVSLQGTLFLLPADGSAAQPLTDAYYDAREPQFSADGSKIVFQGYRLGNWDLWQVGRDGSEPVALTDDLFDDREPQFSPDGNYVVFSSDRSGRYDIWRLELASGELSQLTESTTNAYAPSWSANGDLAFMEEGSRGARLMMQYADGTRALLVEQMGSMVGAQWSPDGTQVAFQIQGAGGSELKVVQVGSNMPATLSPAGSDVFPFKPTWLNEDKLAYAADGKIYTRTLASEAREEWPFAIDLELTRHDYVRRARDYDARRERLALGISAPQISNNGSDLYFSALGDLWRWQPALDELNKLTDDAYAETALALSPDGGTLAYVSDAGGVVGLRLLDLALGETRTLGIEANAISGPSWSPDGTRIAYFVDVPGNPLGAQMMVMTIATGEAGAVLEPMPGQPISWSEDGTKVAVTRLNPYSSRYREGLYELLVVTLAEQTTTTISPTPHRSMLGAVLTPDGAMTYVEGGLLHRLELDADNQPLEAAGLVTQELTDMPQWSANGEYLIYLSGNRLKRLQVGSGELTDITPTIPYTLAQSDDAYVIRAGRVFTGLDDVYLENQDIVVRGNRIERIGPSGNAPDLPVIDATDKTVVPGLFEMHAHMGETSETQGRVWLSYGITTVRDPGSNPYMAKEQQEAWDSGRRAGPRTHITGYLTDGNRVFYSMAEGISSDAHLDMALARTEQLGLDFIKTYVRLPDLLQKRVVDFAHELGIPVSSHELYPAVAHGMDHVEHIGGTSRRGYQPKVSRLGYSYGDVVTLLSESGMGITPTAVLPGFAVIVMEEPDWFETPQFENFYGANVRRSYEMMAPRFGRGAAGIARANGKLLKALTERDALLVTGTDSPFVPYGAGLHAEFRLYDRAGVPSANILRQATMNSAIAAGVAGELGSIEVGKLADMVVVDGDPLADIRDLDNVVMTIKNGQRYTLEEMMTLPSE